MRGGEEDAAARVVLVCDPVVEHFFPRCASGVEVSAHPLCIEGCDVGFPVHDSRSSFLLFEVAGEDGHVSVRALL